MMSVFYYLWLNNLQHKKTTHLIDNTLASFSDEDEGQIGAHTILAVGKLIRKLLSLQNSPKHLNIMCAFTTVTFHS